MVQPRQIRGLAAFVDQRAVRRLVIITQWSRQPAYIGDNVARFEAVFDNRVIIEARINNGYIPYRHGSSDEATQERSRLWDRRILRRDAHNSLSRDRISFGALFDKSHFAFVQTDSSGLSSGA